MNRKNEYQKIYRRIDELAKEGRELFFDYIKLIDEFIEEGLYYSLSDVMISKYGIKIEDYRTLEDFKRISFKMIRQKTNSTESTDLASLFGYRRVYSLGRKIFDTNNNLFLGEIGEYKDNNKSDWYRDPKLEGNGGVNIEYYWGLNEKSISKLGTFSDNSITKGYSHGDLIKYEDKIWNCYVSYTYSANNRITPTYSSNWVGIFHGTFSYNLATGSEVSLFRKWDTAISGVKSFLYSDPNSTNSGTFSFD